MAGRVLAVDYGGKRTGLAVSDFMGITAQPLAAIISESLDETVRGIVEIVVERQIPVVLIGMPFLPDGREGAQVARVRLFISALETKLPEGTEIEEIDERHSTKEAEAMWRQAGYSKKKAKSYLDSTAAVVLLREYLHLH
jgi:putative Holliday junction resolvase